MTSVEIIELAERLGLHCDYDDDPEQLEDETIFLWHDADLEPDGGLLIRFHDGQAYIADLKTWALAEDNHASRNGFSTTRAGQIHHCIGAYAERCNLRPRVTHGEPKDRMNAAPPRVDRRKRGGARLPRTQRKEGAFKAVDPLGHFYYVEVFREISGGKVAETPRLVTEDGEKVEWVAKGRYRLAHARIELSSSDPAAP
jgi:hypothetical protein